MTASSIFPFKPVWKYEFKKTYSKIFLSSLPFISKYFSNTILSSVKVPVLSVHKIFMEPKLCILSSLLTIVFFLDIFTAPLERLEDRITGKSKGVIPIAMATENVKAVSDPCFALFSKNVIGINISINLIKSLLKLLIPFWKLVIGFPEVIVFATFPKYVLSPVFITIAFPLPLVTLVPIKQIVSKSVILSISSIDESSVDEDFFTESDSPVKDDWVIYKSFASNTLTSAGMISPADKSITSPIVISFKGIFILVSFLITVQVVATKSLSFSAALFEL